LTWDSKQLLKKKHPSNHLEHLSNCITTPEYHRTMQVSYFDLG